MAKDPMLRQGHRGADVVRLQQMLNEKLKPSPNLKEDGIFGLKTKNAVVRYQNDEWLSNDGIVGPATWCTLEKRDKFKILHNIEMVPQFTDQTCWSAALAMLLGVRASMLPGKAKISAKGGLYNDSDLSKPENTKQFAESYGLTVLPGHSWLPDGLANMLRVHGPLMMNLLWNAPSYIAGRGSPGHMLIIAGIRGDGNSEASTIRIYDPWPVSRGSVYSLTYGPFMRKMPASTYQMYHI